MMIFKGPWPDTETIVYLPSPSLNDIKRLTLTQDIKRNLNHEIITYIKRNTNRQFSWQFIISLAKRWELFYFMREYMEKQIQVIDIFDRVLAGYLINGTHTFVNERRGDFPSSLLDNLSPGDELSEELVSITVDFVGNYI